MINAINGMCMTCHQKYSLHELDRLIEIERFLNRHVNVVDTIDSVDFSREFLSEIHPRCRYGIGKCIHLDTLERRAYCVATAFNKKLICFLHKANESDMENISRLCLGYFPKTYRALEKYWYQCSK